MELPEAPDAEAVAAARAEMDRPGVEVETRKMWPTGLASIGLDLKGKIPPAELAEPGRAVARLDGLGWSGPLRDLLAPTAGDGELPVPLRRAAARVLDEWSALRPVTDPRAGTDGGRRGRRRARGRPAGDRGGGGGPVHHPAAAVVPPGHRAREVPRRADDRCHRSGRRAGTAGRHDVNSAMRLAGVARRLQLQLGEGALRGLPGRTVLLVDDYTDSGWTLTVAARLLREAGAAAVYPFVLGVR